MENDASQPNPYAAPVIPESDGQQVPLGDSERLFFSGAVSRETILAALASGPLTHGELERLEQQLLQRHPELYAENRRGWFDNAGMRLEGDRYDMWIRWPAVYSMMVGTHLMEIFFAGGLSGSIILEERQFTPTVLHSSETQYQRCVELIRDSIRAYGRRWPEWAESLHVEPAGEAWPREEACLARGAMQMTARQAFWAAVRGSMQSNLKNVVMLSFAWIVLYLVALRGMFPGSVFWLVAPLLAINAIYLVAALRPLWPLWRAGRRDVLRYEMRLTEDDVWMALSAALVRRRIDSYQVVEINEERIMVQRCPGGVQTHFERSIFIDESHWRNAQRRWGRQAELLKTAPQPHPSREPPEP